MGVKVDLSWYELELAVNVGSRRQMESIRKNLQDAHGYNGEDGWTKHIEGACGEMVVAKLLGMYWDGSVNTFKRPDVGTIQVRTRSKSTYDLIVRPNDEDDSIFVLVTGVAPSFEVVGFIRGGDAKQEAWSESYGDRPSAFFVPQESLMPIENLVKQRELVEA